MEVLAGEVAGGLRPRLTAKGQATRDRIVDAAVELIALRGVAGTSTEQVRLAAGVSGSQLYHYFDSKQSLVRAVIVRQADEVVSNAISPLGALDSLEALHAWAEATVERQAALNGRQCSLSSLAGELVDLDEVSRVHLLVGFERWKVVLRSGLLSMQENRIISPEADLNELSEVLLAALHGGSQLATLLGRLDPLRSALHSALALIGSFSDLPTPEGSRLTPSQ